MKWISQEKKVKKQYHCSNEGCEKQVNGSRSKPCAFCKQKEMQQRSRDKQIAKQKAKYSEKQEEILREYEIEEQQSKFPVNPKPKKVFSKEEEERRALRLKRKEDKQAEKKKKPVKRFKIETKKLSEKTPLKYWEDKLDDAIREYTKSRDFFFDDTFCCISCEEIKPIDNSENGHYYRRSFKSTRWDIINNNRQCTVCNRIKEGNQGEYRKGLIKKFGLVEIELLDIRANQIVKYSAHELEEMYNGLILETELLDCKNKRA